MGVLEWLGQLLSELWPPWVIVPRTHVGVRQRNVPLPNFLKRIWDGTIRRVCGSGFIFKTPFLDEVWELPVTLESEDLDNIEVETADGIVYDISPVLTWKVSNPLKATFDVSNYEESLHNRVRAIIVSWANRQNGRINVEQMERECTELVRKIGSEWGCFAQGVTFNSCARPWDVTELHHRIVKEGTWQTRSD
jgi:hypothetical protein